MLFNKTIAVVVPAYNEETQIVQVIESMPDFVDRIVVVNDLSTDNTADVVKTYIDTDSGNYYNPRIAEKTVTPNRYNEADVVLQQIFKDEIRYFTPSAIQNTQPENDRIILINHLKNGGVGAAIARGYKWCKDNEIDCTAVMAGDGQMDPSELEMICKPVVAENLDYVKGNRLMHKSAKFVIPKQRHFGNSVLSILTKLSSGYWRVSDTQTGYTAISLDALKSIKLYNIYPKYGMPNDMLVKLNIASSSIREIEIKPVYRVGEVSKMKVNKVIPRIIWLLFRSFFTRLVRKYFLRDFHPLFLFYMLAFLLSIANIPFLINIVYNMFTTDVTPISYLIIFIFLFISSLQSFFFAMWMDIQDNERLYK
ncbi:MAG: glycosyltransferase [Bacteroidales bacterium]|nr:glycosyltransferase [Bacteroidales bacterium]HOY37663.1 glycosyltransferase family 2 protein [Bacteroidales bacterium]HQP04185.1 glycosyltransferase family 2 protein [Bacteroidales bacterium]